MQDNWTPILKVMSFVPLTFPVHKFRNYPVHIRRNKLISSLIQAKYPIESSKHVSFSNIEQRDCAVLEIVLVGHSFQSMEVQFS